MRCRLLILTFLAAAAGAVAGPVTPPPPPTSTYAIPADYSWTQLLSLDDPATLEWLTQLVNSLGPNAFLSTGNTAYDYLNFQLQVVGNPPDAQAVIPEPGSLILLGLGLAAILRPKTLVQVQELVRR